MPRVKPGATPAILASPDPTLAPPPACNNIAQ